MIETGEILQTMRMIREENFDIRTITLGLNLLDCSGPDAESTARRCYDKCAATANGWWPWARRSRPNTACPSSTSGSP